MDLDVAKNVNVHAGRVYGQEDSLALHRIRPRGSIRVVTK